MATDRKAESPKAGRKRRHCEKWPFCIHTAHCKKTKPKDHIIGASTATMCKCPPRRVA